MRNTRYWFHWISAMPARTRYPIGDKKYADSSRRVSVTNWLSEQMPERQRQVRDPRAAIRISPPGTRNGCGGVWTGLSNNDSDDHPGARPVRRAASAALQPRRSPTRARR